MQKLLIDFKILIAVIFGIFSWPSHSKGNSSANWKAGRNIFQAPPPFFFFLGKPQLAPAAVLLETIFSAQVS